MSPDDSARNQIYAPLQARSRDTMDRVLEAFSRLLRDKPFERITMAELAAESKASLPSIYARFKDKNALLFALHEQFKLASEKRIERLFLEASRSSAPMQEILATLATGLCRTYARDRWLLRSVFLSNNPIVYERVGALMRSYSERMAELFKQRARTNKGVTIDREADFAVRAAFAILQQGLVLDGVAPSRFWLAKGELSERLGHLFYTAYRRATPRA